MAKEDNVAALNVYMPEETLRNFKIQCIKEGKPMKAVIIDFCKRYYEDENDSKNKKNSKRDKEKKED